MNAIRQSMIERLQKVLTSYSRFSTEHYRVITQDETSAPLIVATLQHMITQLEQADSERFLRADEELYNEERRHLEQFGI